MLSSNPLKKVQNSSPKKVRGRKPLRTVINVKNTIFVTFSFLIFLHMSFLQLFQRIRNQHQILSFFIPMLLF
jgi:hypothetical protein